MNQCVSWQDSKLSQSGLCMAPCINTVVTSNNGNVCTPEAWRSGSSHNKDAIALFSLRTVVDTGKSLMGERGLSGDAEGSE